MKRSSAGLHDVADWGNLVAAFYNASRGKALRPEVQAFRAGLTGELQRLRCDILDGSVSVGAMRAFRIHDPKPRTIHAPCFRERVLHHALMAHVGPVLDRALVADTYACRVGKGSLAAVRRCQHYARRWPWFAKIDIRAYFASIDHRCLITLLQHRFKDHGLLDLMERIVDAYAVSPGKGLPIGALSSQHFANMYLGGVDRLLLEICHVRGMVRYMDDIVWWGDSSAAVSDALQAAEDYARSSLLLEIKQPPQVGRSTAGVTFCGYRILPGTLRLTRRRRRRYSAFRREWECAFRDGHIDAAVLQSGYAGALAITAHADAAGWRRQQLRRVPLEGALAAL